MMHNPWRSLSLFHVFPAEWIAAISAYATVRMQAWYHKSEDKIVFLLMPEIY